MTMPRFLTNPRHLLPLMIFMGILIVGLRVSDVWESVSSGKIFSPPDALAETKGEASQPASASTTTTSAPAPTSTSDTAKPADKTADTPASPSLVSTDDGDVSPAEIEVLKQLSDRREQLDKRAKDLDTRESLIKVTEQRVDQKIKEMETLRLQLQSMVSQASEAQAVQIENLVKIYETMKPEDAARIFESLDMPTLLGVVQRMKPARTAPIMAKMAPDKAKDLTVALTKQDQLPKIK